MTEKAFADNWVQFWTGIEQKEFAENTGRLEENTKKMNLEPREGLKNPTPGAENGTRLARKHAKITGHAAETRLGNDHEAGLKKQSLQ